MSGNTRLWNWREHKSFDQDFLEESTKAKWVPQKAKILWETRRNSWRIVIVLCSHTKEREKAVVLWEALVHKSKQHLCLLIQLGNTYTWLWASRYVLSYRISFCCSKRVSRLAAAQLAMLLQRGKNVFTASFHLADPTRSWLRYYSTDVAGIPSCSSRWEDLF